MTRFEHLVVQIGHTIQYNLLNTRVYIHMYLLYVKISATLGFPALEVTGKRD